MHTTMKNSVPDIGTIEKNIFHYDGSLATTESVANTEEPPSAAENKDTGK